MVLSSLNVFFLFIKYIFHLSSRFAGWAERSVTVEDNEFSTCSASLVPCRSFRRRAAHLFMPLWQSLKGWIGRRPLEVMNPSRTANFCFFLFSTACSSSGELLYNILYDLLLLQKKKKSMRFYSYVDLLQLELLTNAAQRCPHSFSMSQVQIQYLKAPILEMCLQIRH